MSKFNSRTRTRTMNMREVKTVQYDALHNTAASNKNIRSSLKARNYPGFSFAGGIFLLNTTEAAQQLSLSSPVSASAYAVLHLCGERPPLFQSPHQDHACNSAAAAAMHPCYS